MPFSKLPLSSDVLSALPEDITSPKEIQTLAIPVIMSNKDLLALAQTGSGKTLAYGLALIERAKANRLATQAVILAPTRELAAQINTAISSISHQVDINTICLSGGIEKKTQIDELANKPEIVVATPGRLLELIREGSIELSDIHTVILDEVDRLLDMGFWGDIQTILERLPAQRQTAMFSATLHKDLENKVNKLLNQPTRVQAHASNSIVEQIEESLYLVNKGSKTNVLIRQIKQNDWQQVLVFIGAKDNADSLTKKLNKANISTAALHGNKSQIEREETLTQFKQKKVKVLIATDLLARGIHIDHLPIVINFELPPSPEVYVHRIGRTARAGKQGSAISLVCHAESDYLNAIRQFTRRELPLSQLEDFPVTDQPSTGESKRAPRDKKANRRTINKKSVKQFQGKKKP
ncbi:DEAD/DEAH box helicase [Vibrio algarum]|uniref:DEAD/DEAH box helicase n=1 Tax=Vibrio algarum TaxID=3020714 RepID=A0ABT4YR54_9VIBR|nr:DEAD/DEAH box helicase [Vibrio sp. KJ40-1]MDB1124036.1 DEAD/DEAH box helicase [Vibrio sp. KJ40-1]